MPGRGAYGKRNHGGWQPSDRQREVLDLLAEGKSNAEIAVRLGISPSGAKWHVGELLAETGCADRRALAAWWRRERERAGKTGLYAGLSWRHLVSGAVAVAAGLLLLAVVAALTSGGGGPAAPEATLGATPTPWPDEALKALAAAQGPAPATCEPPEAQDLRLVDAAELTAQGLEPVGRVIVAGHCPLYVANRVDRAVVWVGGGGLLYFDRRADRRLMTAHGCCAQALLTVGGVNYQLSGSSWSDRRAMMTDSFTVLDQELARIGPTDPAGAYMTLTLRASTPTPGAPRHRVAFASDGQMFIDPRPVSGDLILNDLTGEEIDVNRGPYAVMNVSVSPGRVRTDCWDEHAVCKVYLDGVGAEGEGVFSPPTLPAPFDGVLSCVADEEGSWNIDGPALAYELSNGNLVLSIGAFGGYAEEWEDCEPRDVRRGEAFPVWTYTRIEAVVGGERVSIVSTRDGRLYVGEVELELGCPCEGRN